MRPGDLTAQDIAVFARYITDSGEYDSLPEADKAECEGALAAAKAAAGAYTGLVLEESELEDVAYAIKVLAAEMLDNRQITNQYTSRNPLVMQILDMHSTNLLPSVEEDEAT